MGKPPIRPQNARFPTTAAAWKTRLAGIPLALWHKLPTSALFGLLLLVVAVPTLVRGANVDPIIAVMAAVAVFVVFEGGALGRQYLTFKQAQLALEAMAAQRLAQYDAYFDPIAGLLRPPGGDGDRLGD